jgi:3'(2'), 5'-bisphosphate nucleotidase
MSSSSPDSPPDPAIDLAPDLVIDLAHDIEDIAVLAGRKILEIYGAADVHVVTKADQSPLTAADTASQEIIVARLRQRTPGIPILSEESETVPWSERSTWSRFWLVDPLDGTKEFIKRNGEFTVNIALVEQGVPRLGVVHIPAQDTTYVGVAGQGAYKRVGQGAATAIAPRPAPSSGLRISVSRSHPSAALAELLGQLPESETIPLGSSLKLCYLAEGTVDFYPRLGPTSEWDIGAAQAVLEAAGGAVVRTDGTPLRYGTKESLLNPHFLAAGDPAILPRILAIVANLSPAALAAGGEG